MTSPGKYRWGNTIQLPCETPIKEKTISSNSLWFRKIKQCMHVMYSKTFYICDYFIFLTRNSEVTVSQVWPWSRHIPLAHFKMATFSNSRIWFARNYVIHWSDRNVFSITKCSIKVGKLYTSILLRILRKFSQRLL